MELRQTAQKEALEKEKIELRRREHADRLRRIMDEKQRTIGFDYDALNEQIAENKARADAERAEEEEYQRRFLEQQKLMGRLTKQEQRIRRQMAQEDVQYWQEQQRFEDRREYDLNRKDYIQAQPPMRTSDNDPWLSVSSCLKMDGEDLTGETRNQRQREQLERWYTQQRQEMENRRAKEIEDQRHWEEVYLQNSELSKAIGDREAEARTAYRHFCDQENKRLANEKHLKEERDRIEELRQNQEEIDTVNATPTMSEDRGQAYGPTGKMVPMHYKGMTEQERLDYLAAQREQRLERERERQERVAREQQEEADRMKATRAALREQRRLERERKAEQERIAKENYEEGLKQRELEEIRNKETFGENQPTDEFWKYFGCSHR